jgi:hypothetical protein
MSSLLDAVTQQLGGGNLSRISQQIGADEGATQNAIGMALPVLVGGLARNASQPAGAAALDRALDNHDGGLLDNLGQLLGGQGAPGSSGGAGILGHILGAKQAPVEQGIGKATGLTSQQVGRLMMMLAPIVMAVLARRKREQGTDAGGLGPALQQEHQEVQRRIPGAGGLADVLDRNDDGSIVDDLARMTPGMLGGLLGGRG